MGVQIPTREGAILRAKKGPAKVMPGRYKLTQSNSAGTAPARYACLLRYTIWGVYWRHLTNTTEPSMCGGDAALNYFDHFYYHFDTTFTYNAMGIKATKCDSFLMLRL